MKRGVGVGHERRAAWWTRAVLSAGMIAVLGGLAAPEAARGQSAEDAVVQVVVDLFDAMRERDEAKLQGVFMEGARLMGPSTDEAGMVTVRDTPIPQFISGIMGAPADTYLDERIYDPEVRIDGNLATVWVAYDFYAGDQFSHCGYDAFQLANTNDGWKIFQIADTRQREGCPER
jgi:hypothetical protein